MGDEIPLFDGPAFDAPPVAGEEPGPPGALDGVSLVAEDEGDGAAFAQGNSDGFGRTETSARGLGLVLDLWDGCDSAGNGCSLGCGTVFDYREGLHTEGVGAVRVFKDCASDTDLIGTLANDGANAGEGDVEAVGLGELRSEEALLDFAGRAGFGCDGNREDGSGRRVGLQVEVKEAEPEAAVVAGECGADGSSVGAATVEREPDGDRGEGQNLRRQAGDEVVEEDAEDEEERVEEFDRSVEFGALFEGKGRVGGDEEVWGNSLGELAEEAAGLAEAGDEFFFREGGEGAESEDAPAGEGFGGVGRVGEDRDRERSECGGFFAGGDDGGGPS